MIAQRFLDPLAQLYALEAENSGLREALRCIGNDFAIDLARDLEAVREAQRERDARMLDELLLAAAQQGKQVAPGDVADVAERIRSGGGRRHT